MYFPSPKDLREATQRAIQRGKEQNEKRLAKIAKAEQKQKERDNLFAEHILESVLGKCENAAAEGRDHVIIMGLKHDRDYTYNHNSSHIGLIANQLKGPARIVWDELVKSGLNIVIESWHDGVGINGGFNIVVKW